MEAQKPNLAVSASHWSKKSKNRCTEEGKKNNFNLLMSPAHHVAQLAAKTDALSSGSLPWGRVRG